MAEVVPYEQTDEPSDYGSLRPGTRLGRYELLVPVARGGMARVWAARLHGQRSFQKLVAIKTILPHLAVEPEFERMFLDEARIASGVHHPNVCEIYELGEEDKTLYLAMEWVSGDSLARVLRASGRTEAIDPRVVARIIADACAGIHAAHELRDDDGRSLGVVHRDLSPHNILLTADGTAKVADFGVAKALGQLHEATTAGQLKGKIAYMAPEQVTGTTIDRRSDVFSLGCVLYEATTGQRPFRGEGDHQVMHAVLKGEYPAPSTLLRGYPAELERIVQRALSPQPVQRFATAERLRFALEEFIARGQVVTQSNVAQIIRARIGDQIDRRKERIRQASLATGERSGDRAADREAGWSEPPGALTPSNQDAGHRSGVKPSGAHAASPAQIPSASPPVRGGTSRPPPVDANVVVAQAGGPAPSTTMPHAPPYSDLSAGIGAGVPVAAAGSAQGADAARGGPTDVPSTTMPALPTNVAAPSGLALPPLPSTFGAPSTGLPQTGPADVAVTPGHPGFYGAPVVVEGAALPMSRGGALDGASGRALPSSPRSFADVAGEGAMGAPLPGVDPSDAHATDDVGAGHYIIAIAIGVLLAVVIGVGGFYLVFRNRTPEAADAPESSVSPVSSVSSGAPGAPLASGAIVPGAPTSVPSIPLSGQSAPTSGPKAVATAHAESPTKATAEASKAPAGTPTAAGAPSLSPSFAPAVAPHRPSPAAVDPREKERAKEPLKPKVPERPRPPPAGAPQKPPEPALPANPY